MTYQPRLPRYAKQEEGLALMRGRKAFALLMQMRCGKTKLVLDDFGEMEDAKEVSDLLVVAPAGSYRNWAVDRGEGSPSELRRHLSPELFERAASATWVSQSAPSIRAVDRLLQIRGRPRVLVVNVEALSQAGQARDAVSDFVARGGAMMVVDESTRVKNHKAERTKAVTKAGDKAAYRRIMSGLVAPRSPLDLYAQFHFLDPRILGFWSYYTFRSRYAVTAKMPVGEWFKHPRTGKMTRREADIVVAYKNTEELQERIAPHSFRCLLSDCYDMQETAYSIREVKLTEEQRRIYNNLRDSNSSVLADGSYASATERISQLLRMHQVLCGHITNELGDVQALPERRTEALLELLDDYDGKAVVWFRYAPDLIRASGIVEREFGEGSVARFWGGNREARHEDEARFKSDPRCRFMFSTPGAGGLGNTWDVADLTVYYSNSFDLEHREQSEARTQAVGKTRPLACVDLVAPGTFDEAVVGALRKKIDVASALMGDEWRRWVI